MGLTYTNYPLVSKGF